MRYTIDNPEISDHFRDAWSFAGQSLTASGQGSVNWIRSNLYPPLQDHLSFRLGNQIFSVLVDVADGNGGTLQGQVIDRQTEFYEAYNVWPCIFPIKEVRGGFERLGGGWNLVSSVGRKPIDPPSLITSDKIEMSDWEVHDCGVQIVRAQIEKEGGEVFSFQSHPAVDPQIWFARDRKRWWVCVRTVRYPTLEAPRPDLAKIAAACREHGVGGYFASVGIANKDDNFDGVGVTPLFRGHGMFIRYQGMKRLES